MNEKLTIILPIDKNISCKLNDNDFLRKDFFNSLYASIAFFNFFIKDDDENYLSEQNDLMETLPANLLNFLIEEEFGLNSHCFNNDYLNDVNDNFYSFIFSKFRKIKQTFNSVKDHLKPILMNEEIDFFNISLSIDQINNNDIVVEILF